MGKDFTFFLNNPSLFSIAEIAESNKGVKFLLFVKPKWRSIANKVFESHCIDYTCTEAVGNDLQLTVFSFVLYFESIEKWEEEKASRSSIAQIIQDEIQESNGITADLFSLYIADSFRPSFSILSPGSTLTLFSGNERDSNSYIREDLGILFRSSWEANIARILNFKHIYWDYEKQIFKMSNDVFYLPDFFLDNNYILEIKGVWDSSSRKKVTTFQLEHSEYKLLLLDSDMYSSISERFEAIIPYWEKSSSVYSRAERIPIVGMKFCANQSTLSSLKTGDLVLFVREYDNKYDQYAIMATNTKGDPIGHVGSDWSFIYASKIDIGMEYSAIITEITTKVIWVTIQRINPEKSIMFDFFK